MAKKKILQENVETVISDTEVNEDSAALDTLKPNSNPSSGPESRYEAIAAMIGAAAAMKSDEFTKFFTDMIANSQNKGDAIPDGTAEKNRATITAKEGEEILKDVVKEDLSKIFEGDTTLTEETRAKFSTLFESAVNARVELYKVALKEEAEAALEEEFNAAVQEITEDLDSYLDHMAHEWLSENEVAVESALRNEIATEFMEGIKKVFEENYLDIPESQVDVVDQLAESVEELETKLNDSIVENSSLKDEIESFRKKEAVEKISEGLTVVEKEKLKSLAETVDASTVEEFTKKLETLKESTFVKTSSTKSLINEQLEEVDIDNKPTEKKVYSSPQMKSYAEAIRRTVKL